jgi:ApaG protein
MYTQSTHSITVTVWPTFLKDKTSPADRRFAWAYRVRIENHGTATVQLISRFWSITDAAGRVEEVRGAGVVGEQPVLRPGEAYEYQSATKMPTPSGIMVGSYRMENRDNGEAFDVAIPAFSLDSPHQPVRLH